VGEPAILPFDWADPFDLNHQLSDEERLVRDTAEGYAQEKLQPRVTSAYLDENFEEHTYQLGTLTSADAGNEWTPSPVLELAAPLVELLDEGQTPVTFRFTAEGEGSSWLVDDIYVDPYGKG